MAEPVPRGRRRRDAAPPSRPGGRARAEVDELIGTVYGELRQIAHHHLRRERRGHTLNTTALVNEAYVKLAGFDHAIWRDRAHFLAIAAQAMRRVLVDYALARKTRKRDGGARLSLEDVVVRIDPRIDDVIAVDAALTRLEELNARLARVVECRFFAGMGVEETADALALSPATVKRDWSVARAWLNKELLEA
ncbi:MAG TPA: ECF-type sigma factor [Vicinamibacterales bacterium]|nr:ECF-type sigma factor [Vicinamibacterales bacterium]